MNHGHEHNMRHNTSQDIVTQQFLKNKGMTRQQHSLGQMYKVEKENKYDELYW